MVSCFIPRPIPVPVPVGGGSAVLGVGLGVVDLVVVLGVVVLGPSCPARSTASRAQYGATVPSAGSS
ncbi:hypothetical protein ADL12_18865 [Streptomyces regalis]|uniref:Uncharacterized protein n=1 Tax=Streptomyces regalis TaxID=68262 RepID=A0A0X3UX34_9ACTN|nr:hypothetical protein ADL12_18865 [Streptomyces regalis]